MQAKFTKKIAVLFLFTAIIGQAILADKAVASAPVSFAPLYEKLQKSVVDIAAIVTPKSSAKIQGLPQLPPGFEDFFKDFFGQGGEGMPARKSHALGSGVVIDSEGYIITNNHVVDGAEKIRIKIYDGTFKEAKLIGGDEKTDIALLQVERNGLVAAPWGDSDAIKIGDWVAAIGNPFGIGKSITAGILSARGRDLGRSAYDDYLQTDAAVNQGNSGGGLFNTNAELIGINTAIASPSGGSSGVALAIPSNQAKAIIEKLKKHGRVPRGLLGVRVRDVSPEHAKSINLDPARGALVDSVIKDGAADKAGLLPGDIILKFDGRNVKDSRVLPVMVADAAIGKSVPIEVLRHSGGKSSQTKTMSIKIDELKEESQDAVTPKKVMGEKKGDHYKHKKLGIVFSPLDKDDMEKLGYDKSLKGVMISSIKPRGLAAAHGIRPGAVVLEINHKKVTTVDQVEAIFKKIEEDKSMLVSFLIQDREMKRFIPLSMKDRDFFE